MDIGGEGKESSIGIAKALEDSLRRVIDGIRDVLQAGSEFAAGRQGGQWAAEQGIALEQSPQWRRGADPPHLGHPPARHPPLSETAAV